MSPIGVTLFTAAFSAVCILFGDYYGRLHFSYTAWLAITVILGIMLVGDIVIEQFVMKSKKE